MALHHGSCGELGESVSKGRRQRGWRCAVVTALWIASCAVRQTDAGLLDAAWVPRQLTFTPDWSEGDPVVSPNGAEIAFTWASGGQYQIHKINSLGIGPEQVLASDSIVPSYTRDGRHILYPNPALSSLQGFWRMDTDGGNKMLATPVPSSVQMANELPDGRLVFLRYISVPMSVWIADADGGNLRQISSGDDKQQPRVSPDGRYVVYNSQDEWGYPFDLFRYDLITGIETQLTFEPAAQGYPAFSPDGQWIVYQSREDGGSWFDIWIMSANDPSIRRQLNNDPLDSMYPQFRPDGSGIVYSAVMDLRQTDFWELQRVEPPSTWTSRAGSGGTAAWQTPTNWNAGVGPVPEFGVTAIVQAPTADQAATIASGVTAQAHKLHIGSNGTVRINEGGTLQLGSGGLYVEATGTLALDPGATLDTRMAAKLGGTGNIVAGGSLTLDLSVAAVDFHGSLHVANADPAQIANLSILTPRLGVLDPALEAGLLGYWPLNEGGGTVTSDRSGNARDGAISGAVWASDPERGTSLSFDGADDFVSIGALGVSGNAPRTIAGWVKSNDAAGADGDWTGIFGWSPAGADGNGRYFDIEVRGGAAPKPYCLHLYGREENFGPLTSDPAWHFLAATYDGTDVRLYLDGDPNPVLEFQPAWPLDLRDEFGMGRRPQAGQYFNGNIDDVAAWNRALSGVELRSFYLGGLSGGPARLGNLTLDLNARITLEGSGVAIFDSIGAASGLAIGGSLTLGPTAGGPAFATGTGTGVTLNAAINTAAFEITGPGTVGLGNHAALVIAPGGRLGVPAGVVLNSDPGAGGHATIDASQAASVFFEGGLCVASGTLDLRVPAGASGPVRMGHLAMLSGAQLVATSQPVGFSSAALASGAGLAGDLTVDRRLAVAGGASGAAAFNGHLRLGDGLVYDWTFDLAGSDLITILGDLHFAGVFALSISGSGGRSIAPTDMVPIFLYTGILEVPAGGLDYTIEIGNLAGPNQIFYVLDDANAELWAGRGEAGQGLYLTGLLAQAVPEPATLSALALGLAALLRRRSAGRARSSRRQLSYPT